MIIEVLHKESKKEGLEYRRHAFKAFTEVLHGLEEDKFKLVYDISQEVLPKVSYKVQICMGHRIALYAWIIF